MTGKRNKYTILSMALLLTVLCTADLMLGPGGPALSPGGADWVLIWKLRLPRILTAVIAGASLSLSGMQLQGIFRNPLADPHILGVSAGAGFGAAIAVIAAGRSTGGSMVLSAFAGAGAASLMVTAASARLRSSYNLLILGVLLGFVFSALTTILQFVADEESLKLYYSWSAGSFSGTRYEELLMMASALAAGTLIARANCGALDIMLFGDDYASLSGAPPGRLRLPPMLSCCLMTGAVTAFCGPIGFVGIVAPHLSRMLTGTSVHRQLIPAAMLCGAAICLAADILSLLSPVPLPAGSTTALLGIPFIILSLMKL